MIFHPDFFSDLDYATTVPETHLEHPTSCSDGDTDRVCGSFFMIFRDFPNISLWTGIGYISLRMQNLANLGGAY